MKLLLYLLYLSGSSVVVSFRRHLLLLSVGLSGFLLSQCTPHTEDAVYVLPDAFRGNAVVVFDQPAGVPPEYSNQYRVYRIPPSGILKTAFKLDEGGFAARKYCFTSRFKGIGPTPEAVYLSYINALNSSTTELADTTVVCFNHGGSARDQASVDIFSVSRVEQADSVFALRQDLIDQVLPPFPLVDSLGTPVDSL